MYVEFKLPTGAGGQAAAHVNNILSKELLFWCETYNISYVKKVVKYTVRVTFADDQHYSFFALTWNPRHPRFRDWLLNFRLIEPMKIDRGGEIWYK